MKTFTGRHFRLIPSKESREFHIKRTLHYTPDKFESYNDWFYFIHVDPYMRWIHALGMVIGVILYLFSAIQIILNGFGWKPVIEFFVGMFFFYFLPLISHHIYDGGKANATPDKFLPTLIPVIHINLLTITGTYDKWLRKFMVKYPFTKEAWALEDKPEPKL